MHLVNKESINEMSDRKTESQQVCCAGFAALKILKITLTYLASPQEPPGAFVKWVSFGLTGGPSNTGLNLNFKR